MMSHGINMADQKFAQEVPKIAQESEHFKLS
jgi:hypothetical protein